MLSVLCTAGHSHFRGAVLHDTASTPPVHATIDTPEKDLDNNLGVDLGAQVRCRVYDIPHITFAGEVIVQLSQELGCEGIASNLYELDTNLIREDISHASGY